jgi:hypothetical protein
MFNRNIFLNFGIDIYATFKVILEQDVNNLNSAKFDVVFTALGFVNVNKSYNML